MTLEVAMRIARFTFGFILSVLFVQACTPAAEIGPSVDDFKAQVRVRSEAVAAAEKAGDYETAITFFAPDVVVQMADAPQIQGKDRLLEIYETVLSTTAEFEGTTTDIVAAASGDLAYEYGINRFVFEAPHGPVEVLGKYLGVWKRIDSEWYITAIATSNDAPPPA
jgi:ketosteroid isomerase-like protein